MCRCSSAFTVLLGSSGDPVHARRRTPVVAFVEFPGPYLVYGQVSVLVAVDDGQNLNALGRGECLTVVGNCLWFRGAQNGRLLVPVVGGAGSSDQPCGRGPIPARTGKPPAGKVGSRGLSGTSSELSTQRGDPLSAPGLTRFMPNPCVERVRLCADACPGSVQVHPRFHPPSFSQVRRLLS